MEGRLGPEASFSVCSVMCLNVHRGARSLMEVTFKALLKSRCAQCICRWRADPAAHRPFQSLVIPLKRASDPAEVDFWETIIML